MGEGGIPADKDNVSCMVNVSVKYSKEFSTLIERKKRTIDMYGNSLAIP
jgi:hypothetical protein